MPDISIGRPAGALPAYLAQPAGDGPWPGVIVVHDALGMTTDLRRQADWLAAEGFLAAAPDLYHWGSRPRCLVATIRQALAREGPVFDDLDSVRRRLLADPRCTGRVGVIGFCLGGGFALLLAAADRGYDASSVNYGGVPDDAEELLAGACPVIGNYGRRDTSLSDDPERLRDALDATGTEGEVIVHPDAGHSFLNDHAPGETPAWAAVMARISNSGFDPEAAADARRRIVAFFDRHLRSG